MIYCHLFVLSAHKVRNAQTDKTTLSLTSATPAMGGSFVGFSCWVTLYHGHNTILVVVDRFLKGIQLGMLLPNHTTLVVATLFMDIIKKLHGMPRSLIQTVTHFLSGDFGKNSFGLVAPSYE